MAGESNDLFSNLPPPYRALPNAKARIEDRRRDPVGPVDYVAKMKGFDDSPFGGNQYAYAQPIVGDPMLDTIYMSNQGLSDQGSYSDSFPPNFAPPPPSQAYQSPAQSTALPPIPPHQIIAPGPAGWNPHGDAPAITEAPFTTEQINRAMQLWQGAQ